MQQTRFRFDRYSVIEPQGQQSTLGAKLPECFFYIDSECSGSV